MRTLQGKVAVITGAAEGIGQALALAVAEAGADVAICDINDTEKTESLLAKTGVEVFSSKVDMADQQQIEHFVHDIEAKFGKVHLLFNNAGIALGDRTFDEVTVEDFEKITNINYWGVIRTTQLLYPLMVKQDEAAIINLSSSQGVLPLPYLVPYCTTKFAVRGFTDTLRVEHKIRGINNITFHTVHPGAIATNITMNADYHGKNTPSFHNALQKGTSAEKAAKTIINGVLKNKGRIFISDGRRQDWLIRLLPNAFPIVVRLMMIIRRAEVR